MVTPSAWHSHLLTVSEVAARLRVSKMTIYQLVHAGTLDAVRIGTAIRVPATALKPHHRGSYPPRETPESSPTPPRAGNNPTENGSRACVDPGTNACDRAARHPRQ
jgi:excisionase family DNA binding protein